KLSQASASSAVAVSDFILTSLEAVLYRWRRSTKAPISFHTHWSSAMKRLILPLLLLISLPVFAQEFRSTLSGRVADATGAVIPNAVVVVTNTDTGVTVKLATDKSGMYTAPYLLPGTYSVSASAPGFGMYVH